MTLRQAADLMFQNNPAFAQKKLQVEIAGKQKQQAQGGYYPQIDFAQSWSRSNNPVYVFGTLLNQSRFTEQNFALNALNNPDAVSDVSSRFQLGWLVYDFGRRENQVRAADAGSGMAGLELQAARALLLQELVKRYYAITLTEQRMEVAEDALRSAMARLDQAKARVDQGLAVQSDLLSAEVYAGGCTEEQIEAGNQHSLSLASLQQLLGRPLDALTATEALGEREFAQHDMVWWKGQMEQNRPELKMASEAVRMARAQAGASRSGLLPSLQAWSSYEWHGSSLPYTGDNWGLGLELRWNLFRGGSDSFQYSAAQLQARRADEQKRETQDALSLQLQSAYYRFQSAGEKARVASTVLDNSAENRRIYGERYQGGLATIQDSLQAETAHSQARLSYLQSRFEQMVAYADLLAATGMPDEIAKMGE
jgi:outer membrane protein TolC